MTYAEFIQNIIDSRGQWNIPDGEYFEMHHIIPYSMNGDGDTKKRFFRRNSHHSNCIWLYAEEHFIAHKLLAEENTGNLQLQAAFRAMLSFAIKSAWSNKGRENLSTIPNLDMEKIYSETRHRYIECLKKENRAGSTLGTKSVYNSITH